MGRSKFPGKPSKHVNRKWVNVLPTNGESSNTGDSMTVGENKQDESEKENTSASPVPQTPLSNLNPKISLKRRLTKKMQATTTLRNKASKRNLIPKMCSKTSINNKLNRTPKLTRKCYALKNSSKKSNRTTQKRETSNLGKFVLPSRSVHSSRVIKPNKRFITVDLNETITARKQKVTKRTRTSADKPVPPQEEEAEEVPSPIREEKVPVSKVVLRQARLQIHTQTPGPEGPFSCSSTTSTNGNPPGTVTCGVCGAVRFYRFVKQARKFNIYSCESCRKFISKMIKRQTCAKSTVLVCHKGQGMCHVPPIVRSQQWKLIRCAYRMRCPACWLKMCLRSFQMPANLKSNLWQLLPLNMRANDTLFNNTVSLFWQPGVKPDKPIDNTQTSEEVKKVEDAPVATKLRPTRNLKPAEKPAAPQAPNNDIKRQKVDLKGPRVKHVCRSASIVLGQPQATFPVEPEKKKEDVKEQKVEEPKFLDIKSTTSSLKEKSDFSSTTSSETESVELEKTLKIHPEVTITNMRKDRSRFNLVSETRPLCERNKTHVSAQLTISIDFWESYDPEDVSQNGFSLISSEKFPMPAICFLCGSAGREALLHCSLCCEPYHPFCLEQQPLVGSTNPRDSMWVCPKCTTCASCNQSDRTKVSCQKCNKPYHPECFNTKWCSDDRPTVCSKCLRCKSCGSENITKYVGNIPLCITCFKLRKKGNFCPLCQKCYDENDFCVKMMECGTCKKWVHSKCEGLLEEQYQILSLLPESVEYICKLCATQSTPYWRKAVEGELKSSFYNVLRQLSKNKIARNMLKWSPLNSHTPSSKAITSVKRLQFSDDEADLDSNSNLSKTLEKTPPASSSTCATPKLTMVDVKNKLNSNEYHSVRDYDMDMEEALNNTHSEQVLKIYRNILHSVFPWYENCQEETDFEASFVAEPPTRIADDVVSPPQEPPKDDARICVLCKANGDGLAELESRLLYCGQNEWIHANCALWSSEVYEEIDGSLQNVHSAMSRGRLIKCALCKLKGASVGCCFKGCYETYHFKCARNAKCSFLHDKTIYCAGHDLPKNCNLITSQHDFRIYRSVYVELDKKKGKSCEINKVNFMVGSLCVTNLGKVNPILSDTYDAIIPTGFVCSRLFWSTVEPWRLVLYTISTSCLSSHIDTLYVDKNFTIDHAQPQTLIDKKFKDYNSWQKELERKKADFIASLQEEEEEPQNAADLLSPELTDAILKELDHDLLDGISVQDIFPKFMGPMEDVDINTADYDLLGKKSEEFGQIECARELKRSKSDIVLPISKPQTQRSCSLTLSCKLDTSLSPAMKKRKILPPTARDNMFMQLLQVDGAADDSSSDDDIMQIDGAFDESSSDEEADSWNGSCEEPVTCNKCQSTYRTQASYKRHLESCELLCTSESDSEIIQDDGGMMQDQTQTTAVVINITDAQTNVISSFESYQNVQMNSATYLTAKTSEMISQGDVVLQNVSQTIEQKPLTVPITINQHSEQHTFIPQGTINLTGDLTNQFCINQPLCVNQPVTIQSSMPLNQNQPIMNMAASGNTIEFQPFTNTTPIINVNQNQLSINGKIITNHHQPNILMQQSVMPSNQWIKMSKPTMVTTNKTIKAKARPKVILAKRTYGDNETIIIPSQNHHGPMIVQHIPQQTSYVPTFIDGFQQQSNQNVQYIATIAPQLNQINQTPMVQFPDNNIVSIVPNMIIQQPQVMENHQWVMDSNGTISLAPQPVQPVFYGFETIVQNTVMQSQQFLPTTVPGVLTANSSYSSTTQVFQTSKLEPVLDVASNSFVLVNAQQPTLELSQYSAAATPQPIKTHSITPIKYTTVRATPVQKPSIAVTQPNSITLPTAPFVQEQGIPTNIVTPTPKHISSHRPMSRVLPMQNIVKESVAPKPQQVFETYSKKPPTVAPDLPKSPTSKPLDVQKSFTEITKPPRVQTVQNCVIKIQKPTEIKARFEKSIFVPQPLDKTCNNDKSVPFEIKPSFTSDKAFSCQSKPYVIVDKSPFSDEKQYFLDEKYEEKSFSKLADTSNHMENTSFELKLDENFTVTNNPFGDMQKSFEKSLEKEEQQLNVFENSIELELQKTVSEIFQHSQFKQLTSPINKPTSEKHEEPTSNDFDLLQKQESDMDKEFERLKSSQKENKPDSLKMVFQKQSRDGTYKISSNKQIAPLKPMKSQPLAQISNKINNKIDRRCAERKTEAKPPAMNDKKTPGDTPSILYTIETEDGFRYSSSSVADLWNKVFTTVQNARAAHNLPPLPQSQVTSLNNTHLLGLKNNGLKYLLEQLPGVAKCNKYKPVHHFPSAQLEPEDQCSIRHAHGSIRSAPFMRKDDNHYDMFGWLSSKHRSPESCLMDTELLPRRGSVLNLPMAMKFRQLKLTSKYSVGVYRSGIHGRGLFCLRDIEAGEMVIEYAGEVIRSILCDKREKEYNKKGIGCYMFRIDDNLVVDATMRGNAARFINHSCDPNCYSKVVEILGHKHIIIFALRRILYSEELTYDYKFPFEEDKIPCTCGTRRCRKFLN